MINASSASPASMHAINMPSTRLRHTPSARHHPKRCFAITSKIREAGGEGGAGSKLHKLRPQQYATLLQSRCPKEESLINNLPCPPSRSCLGSASCCGENQTMRIRQKYVAFVKKGKEKSNGSYRKEEPSGTPKCAQAVCKKTKTLFKQRGGSSGRKQESG